jgi:HEPN domain-containing protein
MRPEAQLIASLLRVAKQDLDGARHLAAIGNRNAIDLCEQGVEKLARAMLTSEGKHVGIKHDLDRMVDQLPDALPLKPALRALEQLSRYATSYRYPTAAGRIVAAPTRRRRSPRSTRLTRSCARRRIDSGSISSTPTARRAIPTRSGECAECGRTLTDPRCCPENRADEG